MPNTFVYTVCIILPLKHLISIKLHITISEVLVLVGGGHFLKMFLGFGTFKFMCIVSLQLLSACRGLVHTVTFLQQLEQLFHWDAGIRRASQGEDLPKQHPK